MSRRKPFRENVPRVLPLTRSRWSSWYTALVPRGPRNDSEKFEQRDVGNDGVIFSEILTRFEDEYDDGIYELGVSRGRKVQVVYIGSSHRYGPGSMNERIREYCRNGSHKKDLINMAMRRGYTLYVRVKNIPESLEYVRECEYKYLAKYDYAWNDINNGSIRANIPKE